MEHNAVNGKFYEPRSQNGRKPSEEFEVVWMPKKNLAAVSLMKQTNQHPATIARTGNRFGLRVAKAFAKATHDQHRPDLQYIPVGDMQSFRVGPLPFGTTKTSLAKIFQHVQWAARPQESIGQRCQTRHHRTGCTGLNMETSSSPRCPARRMKSPEPT